MMRIENMWITAVAAVIKSSNSMGDSWTKNHNNDKDILFQYQIWRIFKNKSAVDFRSSFWTVRINVGLC